MTIISDNLTCMFCDCKGSTKESTDLAFQIRIETIKIYEVHYPICNICMDEIYRREFEKFREYTKKFRDIGDIE